MAANIALFSDSARTQSVQTIALVEAHIEGDMGFGQEYQIFGENTGDTVIREVTVGLNGPGSTNVQLAVDDNGTPGIWADTGQEIVIESGSLMISEEFTFWARAAYTFDDIEGQYPFNFVIRGTSVG